MELGINIRNWGPTASKSFLTECAKVVDGSNLDTVWFNDHIGLPEQFDNIFDIPQEMGSIIDALGFGCFLAAVTNRIKFGTGVLIAPYRPPLVACKLIASIQILSNNRFQLGLGTGYLKEEFKALNVPINQRGKLTNEFLKILNASSEDEEITINAQRISLKPMTKRPPVFIGQKAGIAFKRAIEYGDGWMPVSMSPEDAKPEIERFQKIAEDAGRSRMQVVMMKTLPMNQPEHAKEMAKAYQEAGVTQLVHTQGYDSVNNYEDIIAQLDTDIRKSL